MDRIVYYYRKVILRFAPISQRTHHNYGPHISRRADIKDRVIIFNDPNVTLTVALTIRSMIEFCKISLDDFQRRIFLYVISFFTKSQKNKDTQYI